MNLAARDTGRSDVLRVCAMSLAAPLLILAAVLYGVVSWVPEATVKRDAMCIAFVLAAAGAASFGLERASRGLRLGGVLMIVAGATLFAGVALGWWL